VVRMAEIVNKPFRIRGLSRKITTLCKKLYAGFISLKMNMFQTPAYEKYWSERGASDHGDWDDKHSKDWVLGYWNSETHPHRIPLLDAIKKYRPSGVLEIGCNCGPNLSLIAQEFPLADITGIDINRVAIERGKELFSKEKITNVTLVVGKADDLGMFGDGQFDVVVSDAVLMYIGPDKILPVLKEMVRVTKKSLLLLEWHDGQTDYKGIFNEHWVRNYEQIPQLFPHVKVNVTKLPPELWNDRMWQQFGYVIEVTKTHE